jgi:hypothetical protein
VAATEATLRAERRQQLTADFHAQTAQIAFTELQRFFAGGQLVLVGRELDLVQVAVALAEDDTARFEEWIASGEVLAVTDELARRWLEGSVELWAVVAQPWVLVQEERAGQ